MTVDVVILTMVDGRLHVLLVRRHADPYAGAWALPGGFKRPDETLDQAAEREFREETGVTAPKHLAQFRSYGDPGRDPRTNVVTVAYLAVASELGEIIAGTDADEARLWPVAVAVEELDLAFDHGRILADAIEQAADKLEQTDIATAFVGPTFTLSELQGVYEGLWGVEIDAANFRRSLSSPPTRSTGGLYGSRVSHDAPDESPTYVEATGERAEPGPRGGRPPELFRAGPAWKGQPPLRRPRRAKPRKRSDDD